MKRRSTKLSGGVALLLALLLAGGTWAADSARYTRDVITVEIPEVTLIDQRGDHVSFADIMASDRPVLVEFIYATCTTICPVLSAGYASLQRKVDDLDDVDLISITIDPEHDGPHELREYLDRYGAQPGWDFLTGTRADIDRVMHAFDAWVPDKMSHKPIIFIRSPQDGSWVKLYGFPGSKDLFAEYQRALGEAR